MDFLEKFEMGVSCLFDASKCDPGALVDPGVPLAGIAMALLVACIAVIYLVMRSTFHQVVRNNIAALVAVCALVAIFLVIPVPWAFISGASLLGISFLFWRFLSSHSLDLARLRPFRSRAAAATPRPVRLSNLALVASVLVHMVGAGAAKLVDASGTMEAVSNLPLGAFVNPVKGDVLGSPGVTPIRLQLAKRDAYFHLVKHLSGPFEASERLIVLPKDLTLGDYEEFENNFGAAPPNRLARVLASHGSSFGSQVAYAMTSEIRTSQQGDTLWIVMRGQVYRLDEAAKRFVKAGSFPGRKQAVGDARYADTVALILAARLAVDLLSAISAPELSADQGAQIWRFFASSFAERLQDLEQSGEVALSRDDIGEVMEEAASCTQASCVERLGKRVEALIRHTEGLNNMSERALETFVKATELAVGGETTR